MSEEIIVPVVNIKNGVADIEASYHNKVAVLFWLYGHGQMFGLLNSSEGESILSGQIIHKFKNMGYQITDTSKPLEDYFELAIFKDDPSLRYTLRVSADSLPHCLIKLVCYFLYEKSKN